MFNAQTNYKNNSNTNPLGVGRKINLITQVFSKIRDIIFDYFHSAQLQDSFFEI